MSISMEEKLEEFLRDYGLANLKEGTLTEKGYDRIHNLLEETGYVDLLCGKKPVLYARPTGKAIDVVVMRNIGTLQSGLTYLQVADLLELDKFRSAYKDVIKAETLSPKKESLKDLCAGSSLGLGITGAGYLIADIFAGGTISMLIAGVALAMPTVAGSILGCYVGHYIVQDKIRNCRATFASYKEKPYQTGFNALQTALGISSAQDLQNKVE